MASSITNGILSTAEGFVLSDRIHSAEMYNGGLNSAVLKDFGDTFDIIAQGNGSVTFGTGAFSINGRVGYIDSYFQLSVVPSTTYYVVGEIDLLNKTCKASYLLDSGSILTTNLQKQPFGTSHIRLWTINVTSGGIISVTDNRNILNPLSDRVAELERNYVTLWTGVLTETNSVTFSEDITKFSWLFCSINTTTECVAINIDKNSPAMNGVSGFNTGTNNKDQVIYTVGATKAGNGKGLTLNSVRRTEHTGSAVHGVNVAGSISRIVGVY